MKKVTVTAWQDEAGQKLMEYRGPGRWYIPLAEVDAKTLRELGEAIQEALSDPLVAAIRTAEKEAKQ